MKLLRLGVAFAVVSFGCQDPEFGGEKGQLKLRFGLGGCTFVPAAKGTLARGGATDLLVTDTRTKVTKLNVESASPGVVLAAKPTLELACTSTDCKETQGSLVVDAVSVGSGRIIFTNESGAEIDALALTVGEATSIAVEDGEGRSSASTTIGKGVQLEAKLRGANGEVFAKTPFTWTVEGDAVSPITSKDSVVTATGAVAGTSTVNVKFGDLGGSIQVRVGN